jgi:hypothetical protein
MFYAREFAWSDAERNGEITGESEERSVANAVVVFIHAEPGDETAERKTVARFLKQLKQIARMWSTREIVLYPFSHLGEEKADMETADALVGEISKRLINVGYNVSRTQFGSFVDFRMISPGAPLSRAYRQF